MKYTKSKMSSVLLSSNLDLSDSRGVGCTYGRMKIAGMDNCWSDVTCKN